MHGFFCRILLHLKSGKKCAIEITLFSLYSWECSHLGRFAATSSSQLGLVRELGRADLVRELGRADLVRELGRADLLRELGRADLLRELGRFGSGRARAARCAPSDVSNAGAAIAGVAAVAVIRGFDGPSPR